MDRPSPRAGSDDLTVSSPRNPRVARVAALLRDARRRRLDERIAIEGDDLVAAALAGGAALEEVLVDAERDDPEARWRTRLPAGVEIVSVAPEAMARLSLLGHPPRVVAVARRPRARGLDGVVPARAIVLHEVADPGNVGAMLRTAAAFDVPAVFLTAGCADPYGPKALRAAMGATFTTGLVREGVDLVTVVAARDRPPLAAAVAAGGVAPGDLPDGAVIVLGAEREGLPDAVVAVCEHAVTIPAHGFASLNVAAAGAVLVYELARR